MNRPTEVHDPAGRLLGTLEPYGTAGAYVIVRHRADRANPWRYTVAPTEQQGRRILAGPRWCCRLCGQTWDVVRDVCPTGCACEHGEPRCGACDLPLDGEAAGGACDCGRLNEGIGERIPGSSRRWCEGFSRQLADEAEA